MKAPGLSLFKAGAARRCHGGICSESGHRFRILAPLASPSLSCAQIPSAVWGHQPRGCASPPFPGTLRAWWLSNPSADIRESGWWQGWCWLEKTGLTPTTCILRLPCLLGAAQKGAQEPPLPDLPHHRGNRVYEGWKGHHGGSRSHPQVMGEMAWPLPRGNHPSSQSSPSPLRRGSQAGAAGWVEASRGSAATASRARPNPFFPASGTNHPLCRKAQAGGAAAVAQRPCKGPSPSSFPAPLGMVG